jgi:hypothetical protein
MIIGVKSSHPKKTIIEEDRERPKIGTSKKNSGEMSHTVYTVCI